MKSLTAILGEHNPKSEPHVATANAIDRSNLQLLSKVTGD